MSWSKPLRQSCLKWANTLLSSLNENREHGAMIAFPVISLFTELGQFLLKIRELRFDRVQIFF